MDPEMISPAQMRRLHQLLNERGLMDMKADLVREYSVAGHTSSRKLLAWEAVQMIRALEGNPSAMDKKEKESMRRKMLSIGYQLGFANQDVPGMSRSQINYKNVDAWCRSKYCKVQKGLMEMNKKDLISALNQFEKVLKTELSKI